MLAYSRPGVIELLARTFARIDKLAWDMEAGTVDLTITSIRKQDITLIARYGIEEISAPAGVLAASLKPGTANCDLHLPRRLDPREKIISVSVRVRFEKTERENSLVSRALALNKYAKWLKV
jgi:hypothetical protein